MFCIGICIIIRELNAENLLPKNDSEKCSSSQQWNDTGCRIVDFLNEKK